MVHVGIGLGRPIASSKSVGGKGHQASAGVTRIEAPRRWDIGTGVPLPNRLRAARGGSRSRDWGQYRLIWRAQSTSLYNGDLGAESPAGFRGRARGQGIKGQSPLKLNTFLCCDMPAVASPGSEGRGRARVGGLELSPKRDAEPPRDPPLGGLEHGCK